MRRLYEALKHWSVTDRFFFLAMAVIVFALGVILVLDQVSTLRK